MNKHTKWYWVRVALVVCSFIIGPFYTTPEAVSSSGVDWIASLFVLIIMPFGMLFVISIQALNPISAPEWRKPSWDINPFLLKEPLQFFHLAAFFFMACGIGACLSLIFRGMEAAPLAVLLFSCGLSVWFGVQISMKIYKKKKRIV